MIFKVKYNSDGNINGICLIEEGSDFITWIPAKEGNRHYQQYLAWVEEGNVAEEWTPEAPE